MILQLLIDSNVTDRQMDRLMNGGNHSVTDRLKQMLQTQRMTFGGYNHIIDRQTD